MTIQMVLLPVFVQVALTFALLWSSGFIVAKYAAADADIEPAVVK